MQYVMRPYTEPLLPWAWWEDAFSSQELDFLQHRAKSAGERAVVMDTMPNEELLSRRRSKVSWMDNTPDTLWIFDRLAHIAASLNSQYYGFDLTGFGEALQLTNYDHAEHGMYGWHMDCGGARTISRKLSVVVQLSDPSEYEGGNLQIQMGTTPKSVPKKRGLLVVFPSFLLHQVTPVTQGSRQSLVTWISGPRFK